MGPAHPLSIGAAFLEHQAVLHWGAGQALVSPPLGLVPSAIPGPQGYLCDTKADTRGRKCWQWCWEVCLASRNTCQKFCYKPALWRWGRARSSSAGPSWARSLSLPPGSPLNVAIASASLHSGAAASLTWARAPTTRLSWTYNAHFHFCVAWSFLRSPYLPCLLELFPLWELHPNSAGTHLGSSASLTAIYLLSCAYAGHPPSSGQCHSPPRLFCFSLSLALSDYFLPEHWAHPSAPLCVSCSSHLPVSAVGLGWQDQQVASHKGGWGCWDSPVGAGSRLRLR